MFDDYGHHPVEIAAVLKAARGVTKRNVVAVMQPHRYTRTHDLYDDFVKVLNEVDLLLMLEVYSAGEKPRPCSSRSARDRAV